MVVYLTYNEQPSGIYSSQVVDVVRFIKSELNIEIKLISFISLRKFFANKKKIKNQWPQALIIPMVPGIKRWKMNKVMLKLIAGKPSCIIARSVLATNLALESNYSNIVYDGRGAISEEWTEYKVVNDEQLLSEIEHLERKAVLSSQNRIAVSNKLVKYWESKFDYKGNSHVVIPCTLNNTFENISLNESNIDKVRTQLGFNNDDVVFVYSGSIAGWQSFEVLYNLSKQLLLTKEHKLLFLCGKDNYLEKLENEFKERVIVKQLEPEQVHTYLSAADYGLLVREQSITNKVASPVKFAEYLACGLKILISEHLGDYSELVIKNNWGNVISATGIEFRRPSLVEKTRLSNEAKEFFEKKNYANKYKKLLGL